MDSFIFGVFERDRVPLFAASVLFTFDEVIVLVDVVLVVALVLVAFASELEVPLTFSELFGNR